MKCLKLSTCSRSRGVGQYGLVKPELSTRSNRLNDVLSHIFTHISLKHIIYNPCFQTRSRHSDSFQLYSKEALGVYPCVILVASQKLVGIAVLFCSWDVNSVQRVGHGACSTLEEDSLCVRAFRVAVCLLICSPFTADEAPFDSCLTSDSV